MPTDRNADIKLSITPDQASAANLQRFVDQLNAGLQKLDNSTEQLSGTATKSTQDLQRFVDKLNTGFTDAKGGADSLTSSLKAAGAEADNLQKKDFSLSGVSGLRRTGGALTQLGLGEIGTPVRLAGDLAQVGKELESLKDIAPNAGAAIAGIAAELGPVIAIALPVALAIADVKLAMDLMKKSADDAAAAAHGQFEQEMALAAEREKTRKDIESKSGVQVKQSIDENARQAKDLEGIVNQKKADLAKIQADFAALGSSFNPAERSKLGALGAQAQKDLEEAMQKQNDFWHEVKRNVDDVQVPVAFKEWVGNLASSTKAGTDNMLNHWKNFFTETEKLTKQSTEKRLADIKKEQDKEVAAADKQRDETIKALQKRDDEIEKIEDNSAQKRLDIAQRYGETLVAIAQKAVDSANAALINLEQKREDLATSFARSGEQANRANAIKELDIRIKDQRQERDDLANHLKNLQDIRQSAREKEADFALNRNFLGLFQNQQQTNRDLNKENANYDTQQQKHKQAEADQLSDLQRQIAVERNERLIAYHNQLQDAQKAYNRELEAADRARVIELRNAAEAKSRELRNAAEAESRQLKIAYDGSVKQIQLINMTEAQKLKIYEAYLAQYARMNIPGTGGDATYNGARNPGTYHINRFAGGGAMNAGQWGMVNEPGSSGFESFSAGGKTIAFPGMGLFKPLKGGNVNGGGPSVNVTIHAPGIDARAAAAIARREVLSGLKQIEGR